MEEVMIIASACLAGLNCKYSGGHNRSDEIVKLVNEGKAIPFCPEQLGGLTTPRSPVEIIGGDGADVLNGKCRVATRDR